MTAQRRRRPSAPVRRISGPAELLQAVPYLLGFHPLRSLVLVGLDGGMLVVTARLDLEDAESGAVSHTLGALVRSGSTSVVGAVYDDDARPGESAQLPWQTVADLLECDAEDAGCEVIDVLLVARGRWWSYTCDLPECCPPEGRELPAVPSPFAAAATYDGVAVLPDRAALAALLEPLPAEERDRLGELIATVGRARGSVVSVKRALFAAARSADGPDWAGLSDAEVARFGAALTTPPIRNAVWMAIDDARIDGRPLWRALGRRLPGRYAAPPLFLFGWASWRAGDGALAGIAAERAVDSDPDYSAADLLIAAVSSGVDPRQLPKLRLRNSA